MYFVQGKQRRTDEGGKENKTLFPLTIADQRTDVNPHSLHIQAWIPAVCYCCVTLFVDSPVTVCAQFVFIRLS